VPLRVLQPEPAPFGWGSPVAARVDGVEPTVGERLLGLPRCVAKGGQLPGSAHGRETCDGVASVTEGVLTRRVQPCRLRAVISLLVCYRPLDNIILPTSTERRARDWRAEIRGSIPPYARCRCAWQKKLGVRRCSKRQHCTLRTAAIFVQTSAA